MWGPRNVPRHRFMLVLKDSFTKTTVFSIFWPKYSLKWPPWAPCRQSKSLKTTVKFLICVYLVSKVLEKCLSINSCWSWRVQSQKHRFFRDFRPNHPQKRPPWAPCRQDKILKTTVQFLISILRIGSKECAYTSIHASLRGSNHKNHRFFLIFGQITPWKDPLSPPVGKAKA